MLLPLVRDGLLRIALAFALAAPVLCLPAPVFAAPAAAGTASATIEAKQAQQAAALADVGRMKAELAAEMAGYVSMGQRLQRTRLEIAEATTRTAQLDASLVRAQAALAKRAVQLYRSEPMGMVELLFGSRSVDDFLVRAQYLELVSMRDAVLLDDVRLLRSESLWLQGSLADRLDALTLLQSAADQRRVRITSELATQQAKARALGTDIAQLMRERPKTFTGGTPSGVFTPDTVISEADFRAAASMSVSDIQRFLEQQPGTLKAYRAPDHNGVTRSAGEMIAEASAAWGISPKVLLVTLQKEQSLLEKTNPTQESYDWAMGAGKADSRTFYEYQGLGKQIWSGAYKLKTDADQWVPGAQQTIDGSIVRPTNAATHGLYLYTPHLSGTMSFWMLYWRYFGDPMA